ncbi:histidine kinase dimerization/phosphoacceptor domain -containing protein [soil metagenome]
MASNSADSDNPEQLADSPALADALESDQFKKFLDHIPFAVAVAELQPSERITYANPEFERLTGLVAWQIEGDAWEVLPGSLVAKDDKRPLSEAIVHAEDYIGTFIIEREEATTVDAWSNIIHDDQGKPTFRLVALAEIGHRPDTEPKGQEKVLARDTLLRELQHRVKNNLQMITALIRLEARNLPDPSTGERFARLAGRVEALALLYRALSGETVGESVDLGVYLSQVASAVMAAHAVEGIHFDLKVDTWPVSIDVAMPAGLVVNEVLTNALKYAFVGREGGKITLRSVVDETGCKVSVADDGVGLAEGAVWPAPGKLASLIVRSLVENAKASIQVESSPGRGVQVTVFFARANAAPEAK